MPKNDSRAGSFPRFEEENLRKNLELADKVRQIADEQGTTPGQLALAWLLHQGEEIVPIPGTKHHGAWRRTPPLQT